MKRYAIIAACAMTLGASAQTLNKEITVDKDYVPVERKAVKQNVLPAVQKNAVDMNATLNYSDWALPAAVPAKIPTMQPYGYLTNKNFDTKRGYATLGAGTQLNLLGNAGYRVLDDANNTLAIWVEHNSTWAGKNSSLIYTEPLDVFKQKFNDNTIGLDFTSRFDEGTMRINARANFDTFNYYGAVKRYESGMAEYNYIPDVFGNQSFSEVGVTGGWYSREANHNFNYQIEAGLGHGGFKKSQFVDYEGVKETNFFVKLGGKYAMNDHADAGAEVRFDYATFNDAPYFDLNTYKIAQEEDNSQGIARISPFVRFHRDNVMLRLGVNADISINAGTTFRIAPNVRLDYVFVPGVGLSLDINGGKNINHLWEMKAMNRYVNPSVRYGTTFVPVDAEASLNIGSFAGFSAKLFGGFASYKDKKLPFFAIAPAMPSGIGYDLKDDDLTSTTVYQTIDISGWKAGAELAYQYRALVDAKVRFTYSPQDADEGCVLGLDRPEYVLDANITVNPISKLAINLGYEMRGNRAMWGHQIVEGHDFWEETPLDNAMNLKVGASYRLLDYLTLFVNANNLMNKQWDVLYGQGAQKLNVMGGASITF
ncbi:MAG: hypothetical protein ACI4AH_08115 [Muribaculaceae bacterium]